MNFPGQTLDGFINARTQANSLLREFEVLNGQSSGLGFNQALVLQASNLLLWQHQPICTPNIHSLVRRAYGNYAGSEEKARRSLSVCENRLGIFTSASESTEQEALSRHGGLARRIYTPTELGHLVLMCFEPVGEVC